MSKFYYNSVDRRDLMSIRSECRFLSRVEGNMSRVEGKKKCFFVWSLSTRSRFSHILGFHLTSGKTKIKNSEFSSSSGRSQF